MSSYRFGSFTLSPRRRLLARDGRELPLIPRYFDLLVLLIERRHEAVHRREIFDRVWGDVIVSDTSLNQAIRTIRRTLGDDSRDPQFIRTVSRHGYRFVYDGVVEVADDPAVTAAAPPAAAATGTGPEPFEPLLGRLTQPARTDADEDDRRDAAEQLHGLGTAEALARLGTRAGHARARALLRDTRWDVAGAGAVPVIGAPEPVGVALELVTLRLRRAARLVARRWAGAAAGAGLAGAAAGFLGGLLLVSLDHGSGSDGLGPVLAAVGAVCGAVAGAGVGAGLAIAEVAARSARTAALIAGAATGGGLVGSAAEWLGRWTLGALLGLRVEIGGAIEGVAIGAAAGLGYALATRHTEGGLAAPRGRRRIAAALVTAALCGAAGLALTMFDRPLVGGTIHTIARAAQGSQISLAPLGRLAGEPDLGPVSRAIMSCGEAAMFGFGLAFGLTSRRSHTTLTRR